MGKYFKDNNKQIIGYYSRSNKSAQNAAEFTNSQQFNCIKSLVNECDTIFITTPDGVIENVWNEIKELSIKDKVICHCSGSLSSKIFSNIEYYGAYGYSIHPMFAISDKYNSHKDLKKAFITIEGSQEKLAQLKKFIESLGNKTRIITAENKAKYHAASVIVSNHVIALIDEGVHVLKDCGFNEEEALEALYPLIINNIKNVQERGIVNSLTGPIERGDVETINNHLQCFKEADRELYRLLSRKLLAIAKKKNQGRNYEEIEYTIGEKK